MDILLLISCCLLLVLEEVIKEHAKLLNYFKDVTVQEKKELNVEDILNNWGFNQPTAAMPISVTLEKEAAVITYEESQLNESQTAFFQSFSTLTEDVKIAEQDWKGILLDEPEHNPENDVLGEFNWESLSKKEVDSEILSMSDWEEEPVPTSMDHQLSATASHKISDAYIGEQLWIVEVVGYEQEYIHVSDGATRTWLNIDGFNNIHRGDILSVLVERNLTEHLKVIDIDILQKKSKDFAIEFEDMEFEDENLKNVM